MVAVMAPGTTGRSMRPVRREMDMRELEGWLAGITASMPDFFPAVLDTCVKMKMMEVAHQHRLLDPWLQLDPRERYLPSNRHHLDSFNQFIHHRGNFAHMQPGSQQGGYMGEWEGDDYDETYAPGYSNGYQGPRGSSWDRGYARGAYQSG